MATPSKVVLKGVSMLQLVDGDWDRRSALLMVLVLEGERRGQRLSLGENRGGREL